MRREQTFTHEAFVYRTHHELQHRLRHAVGASEDQHEPLAIVGRRGFVDVARELAGPQIERIRFAILEPWSAPSANVVQTYDRLIQMMRAAGASRCMLVSEPPWDLSSDRWARYESVINEHFAREPVQLTCMFCAADGPDGAIEDVLRTHPLVTEAHTTRRSYRYVPPRQFLEALDSRPLPPPPRHALVRRFDGDYRAARHTVRTRALAAGLDEEAAHDVMLAVHELLTNAARVAPVVELSIWCDDVSFSCEVRDNGPGLRDRTIGYAPPATWGQSGRGLWIARGLLEEVDVRSGAHGVTARLTVPLRAAPPRRIALDG